MAYNASLSENVSLTMQSDMMRHFHFYKRHQLEGESISSFCAKLQELSTYCDFGGYLMVMLRDKLVIGLRDENIRKRLLEEHDLTYKKAKTIALAMESENTTNPVLTEKELCSKDTSRLANDHLHKNKKPLSNYPSKKKVCTKKSQLIGASVNDEDESFSCVICEKTFSTKVKLLIHSRIHTKPYSCEICNKSFSIKNNLRRHQKIHSNDRPFACDVCDKTFHNKHYFEKHKLIHTDEAPYICNICEKAFMYRSKLRRHQSVHMVEKPFVCDVCDKRFGDQSLLLQHKRIHMNYKPFICFVCNESFSDKSILLKHSVIHSEDDSFPQETFGEGIQAKHKPMMHEIIRADARESLWQDSVETEKKPFSCEMCHKSFSLKGNLLQHYRGHKKKEISCDICKVVLISNLALARHKRLVHKKEKSIKYKKKGRPTKNSYST